MFVGLPFTLNVLLQVLYMEQAVLAHKAKCVHDSRVEFTYLLLCAFHTGATYQHSPALAEFVPVFAII